MPYSARALYTLHLADNALILGHRNSEWTGHGPILEQDIAISNIALDLIGQARNLYQHAATLINGESPAGSPGRRLAGDPAAPVTEDWLAYHRDGWDFRNCLLVEQANGDWARTILRQFFFSTYQFFLYDQLQHSRDTQLSAIGEKSVKEVAYHLRWSSEWVIRLGDGTDESHQRMTKALDELGKYTEELLVPTEYERQLAAEQVAVDLALIRPKWEEKVFGILAEGQLSLPTVVGQKGGKEGRHTEQLGYVLAEMQFLQRAYPGCEW